MTEGRYPRSLIEPFLVDTPFTESDRTISVAFGNSPGRLPRFVLRTGNRKVLTG